MKQYFVLMARHMQGNEATQQGLSHQHLQVVFRLFATAMVLIERMKIDPKHQLLVFSRRLFADAEPLLLTVIFNLVLILADDHDRINPECDLRGLLTKFAPGLQALDAEAVILRRCEDEILRSMCYASYVNPEALQHAEAKLRLWVRSYSLTPLHHFLDDGAAAENAALLANFVTHGARGMHFRYCPPSEFVAPRSPGLPGPSPMPSPRVGMPSRRLKANDYFSFCPAPDMPDDVGANLTWQGCTPRGWSRRTFAP